MNKILTIIGARPQFVKAAILSRIIKNHSSYIEKIIHTGQHYDKNMSQSFFDEMEIPEPNYKLQIKGSGHAVMTGGMMTDIEEICYQEKPDFVLVYGDTNTTLAGSLTAAKLNIPIIHIESGLRSYDMTMPEEINRILTDKISKYLFCPTKQAIENLAKEGIYDRKEQIVKNVGDIMYDAVKYYQNKAIQPKNLNLQDKEFILATIHRPVNTDNADNLNKILASFNKISETTEIILPLHPRTKQKLQNLSNFKKASNLHIIDPVSYFEMLFLLENCKYVFTDSGGLQKEAYFFAKPCLVLRDTTEWIELITENVAILSSLDNVIDNYAKLSKINITNTEIYGKGNTGEEIIKYLG